MSVIDPEDSKSRFLEEVKRQRLGDRPWHKAESVYSKVFERYKSLKKIPVDKK